MTESIIQRKICHSCKTIKSFDSFSNNKTNKDGKNTFCKPCQSEYFEKWRKTANGKERIRSARLKWDFGIEASKYEEIKAKQNNVCAICKTHTTKNRLHVDHCHKTGKIRGLLCSRCNQALGLFKDNIKWLDSAIQYLKHQDD